MTNMHQHEKSPQRTRVHRQLNDAHGYLLAVHKALLDHERVRYERAHGPIGSPGEVLQLGINDPWFAWLRPLTALITQMDEFVSSKTPPDITLGPALLKQSRALLTPAENAGPFQSQYLQLIQESPEIAAAHAQWKLMLRQLDRDP